MKIEAALGVISSDPLIRKGLTDFAERFGFKLKNSCSPESIESGDVNNDEHVDCWLVDEAVFETPGTCFEAFLEDLDVPVIYGLERFSSDTHVLEREWNSLLKKLVQHVFHPEQRAEFDVWVLGASLGGPEAVKAFLDELPENLPVCFLYAQHLDEVGSRALLDVIGRDAALQVFALDGVTLLQPGAVYKMPVDSSVEFVAGTCFKTDSPWVGSYRPSIEELLRKVSYAFGQRANVIYFSGMGEDGALIANDMARRGSRVWAQSAQTCASAAMPESVISQRICERIASPSDLATLLKALYQTK